MGLNKKEPIQVILMCGGRSLREVAAKMLSSTDCISKVYPLHSRVFTNWSKTFKETRLRRSLLVRAQLDEQFPEN